MTAQAQPATPSSDVTTESTGRFGTFAGVFTPNVLTILGIILFLRMGWVVGQAGLWNALIIIAVANCISFLTGLSLSAIATSMKVRGGGNYYLISRSLGLEVGGAIGIPLYLSQAISVAFYIIGFTEAVYASVPAFQAYDPIVISAVVALIFGVIAYIGADFALKIQYFILAILIAALVSFFGGGWGEGSFIEPTTVANYSPGVTFWIVFAVFFPAVTGIEVGVSLSGDLKNPSKSIPFGTISSIVITAIVYFFVAIWFATHMTSEELINNNLAMEQIALWPSLILAGVSASTLSSALGSILAAPRTLQAIALDGVVPKWMAAQLGSPTEPRMGVLITSAIAIAVILAGDLNAVAPIISMFFLNTYGMVNLVSAIEKVVGNPSFRPRFNIPWYLSLLGALGCYGVMFLINTPATILAILISYGIYFYLQRRELSRTWGDVRSGIWFAIARSALLNLEAQRWHVKNWRPNILVFTGQPHNREQLVELSDWLSLGRGIVTFCELIVGDLDELAKQGVRAEARKGIRAFIQERGMSAFASAEIVPDFKIGALTMAQAHGTSGLEPNNILFGWSRTPAGRASQLGLMRSYVALGKSVLFLHYNQERGYGQKKIINVWWRGRSANADLILLLVHLIQQHRAWKGAEVHILQVINDKKKVSESNALIENLLADVNVDAKPVVIVREDPLQPITDLMAEWSRDADLTMLGMQLPEANRVESYGQRLEDLVEAVGTVMLVRNAEEDEDLLSVG
ncbi:MAG: amino acid permease [Ardenticatenaceae bacterium]